LARRSVRHAIDVLRDAPHLGKPLNEHLTGFWRYPVGRLRVIYRFDNLTLQIVAVGPRATIYEDLAVLIRTRQINERRARYAAAHA
jgi:mRNA-degrading endonuclease RelE of RelBE toxin-antitoxin system